MLAGISADYYLRLERGRDRNPSAQVSTAGSRPAARRGRAATYLLGLASPAAPAAARQGASAIRGRTTCSTRSSCRRSSKAGLRRPRGQPARRRAEPSARPASNRLRSLLLDPEEREFQVDWEAATARRSSAASGSRPARRPRRCARGRARRRALLVQRAIPVSVGAARRPAPAGRYDDRQPPGGRAAAAAPGEAARRRTDARPLLPRAGSDSAAGPARAPRLPRRAEGRPLISGATCARPHLGRACAASTCRLPPGNELRGAPGWAVMDSPRTIFFRRYPMGAATAPPTVPTRLLEQLSRAHTQSRDPGAC